MDDPAEPATGMASSRDVMQQTSSFAGRRRFTAIFNIALGLALALAPCGSAHADGGRPVAIILDDAPTLPAVEFERGKTLLPQLITALPAGDLPGLYVAGKPPVLLQEFSADRMALSTQLAALSRRGEGGTLADALQAAWGHGMATHPGAGGVVILITDGRGGLTQNQLPALVEQFVKSQWRIQVLGAGYPDQALLRQLAGMTGGDYAALSPEGTAQISAAIARAPAAPISPGSASAGRPGTAPGPIAPAGGTGGALLIGVGLALAALVAIFLLAGRKPSEGKSGKGGKAIDMTQRAGEPPGPCMLLGKTGPKRGMTLEIDKAKGLMMGRSRTCDVIIADGRLSAQHLRILFRDDRYYVEDLRSTNGTFLNANRILSAELRPGDLLRLGGSEFLIKAGGAKA